MSEEARYGLCLYTLPLPRRAGGALLLPPHIPLITHSLTHSHSPLTHPHTLILTPIKLPPITRLASSGAARPQPSSARPLGLALGLAAHLRSQQRPTNGKVLAYRPSIDDATPSFDAAADGC
eukprot:scaffold1222_cov138-Isochrysis_galbana.AAC.1